MVVRQKNVIDPKLIFLFLSPPKNQSKNEKNYHPYVCRLYGIDY